MNLSAQNALLKTLEEPPADSVIVLIAPNSGGLLPTVRSRCVRLNFSPLGRHEVAAYLDSQTVTMRNDSESLAAMSMGSIRPGAQTQKRRAVRKTKRLGENS